MTTKTISVSTVSKLFPAGTVEELFTAQVLGTDPSGAQVTLTFQSASLPFTAEIPPGTGYSVIVTRNGVSSLPSETFDVFATAPVPTQITIQVPDATAKVVVS